MFHGIPCSAYWIFQILCPNLHFSYIGSESTTWISELGPLFCIVGATGPITSHKTRLCNRKKLRVDYNHDRVLCSIWKNGKAEGVPGGREDYYVESSSGYIPEFSHLQPHLPFFFFFHIQDLAIGIWVRLLFLTLCLIQDLFWEYAHQELQTKVFSEWCR